MSVNGFNINGTVHRYNYEALDNVHVERLQIDDSVFASDTDLYNEVCPVEGVSSLTWTQGSISYSGGSALTATNRLRSNAFLARKGSVISIASNSYKFGVYCYANPRDNFTGYDQEASRSLSNDPLTFVATKDKYYRIVIANNDDSALSNTIVADSGLTASIYKYATEDIVTTYPLMRQYYNVPAIGSTFDIEANTAISTSNYYSTACVDCEEGDTFFIAGVGGGDPRLFAWIAEDGTVIDAAVTNAVVNGQKIVAPSGAVKLIANSKDQRLVLKRILPFREIQNDNVVKEKRLVDGVIVNASFVGTTGSNPRLHYENGCRTFGFHIKDGCKYTVKVINGTSLRLGFVHDEITIKNSDVTNTSDTDIPLKGFIQYTDNPFTFEINGYKTAFLYGSSNTTTADCTFVVIEEGVHENWAECVSESIANEKKSLYRPGLMGSKEFYISEATGSADNDLDELSVSDLYGFYDTLCSTYPHMIRRVTDLGRDASDTFDIREYVMSFEDPIVTNGEVTLSGDLDLQNITNLWKSSMRNNILAISSGMHGNEKAPAWGMALAVQEILSSDRQFAQFIKSNFEVHIVPCWNPYGFENNIRRNSNNVDINRDFLDYSQSETVAFRDWITAIKDRLTAFIDVHGTSGYYAYFEAGGDSPYYEGYCNTCMRFTTAIQKNWTEFYSSFNLSKYPYCFMTRSTYQGTKRSLTTTLGVLGHTIETPQNFINGSATSDAEKWHNDLRSCKLTKDLLINTMQEYGEWGYRIKNHNLSPFDLT